MSLFVGFGTFVLGSFLAQQIVIGAAFTPIKQGQHLPAADSLALEETRATLQDISWKGTLTDSTYPAVYRKSRFVLSPKYFSNFKNKRDVFSMLLGAFHRFLCTLSKTCKFQATKCRNSVFIGITCFLLRAIFSGILHRAHGRPSTDDRP